MTRFGCKKQIGERITENRATNQSNQQCGVSSAAHNDDVVRMLMRFRSAGLNCWLAHVATFTPFGGSLCDSTGHDAARQTAGTWLRTNTVYDIVIDFTPCVIRRIPRISCPLATPAIIYISIPPATEQWQPQ